MPVAMPSGSWLRIPCRLDLHFSKDDNSSRLGFSGKTVGQKTEGFGDHLRHCRYTDLGHYSYIDVVNLRKWSHKHNAYYIYTHTGERCYPILLDLMVNPTTTWGWMKNNLFHLFTMAFSISPRFTRPPTGTSENWGRWVLQNLVTDAFIPSSHPTAMSRIVEVKTFQDHQVRQVLEEALMK